MSEENSGSINISTNYSGACGQSEYKRQCLLRLTEKQCKVSGATLFTMKYDVLPCVANEKCTDDSSDSDSSIDDAIVDHLLLRHSRQDRVFYHAASIERLLIDEYKVDPNTFYYRWTYDSLNDNSNVSNLYIDLGNYLAVEFSMSVKTKKNVDNPNNLQPDLSNNSFQCFLVVQAYHVPQSAGRVRTLFKQLHRCKLYQLPIATLQMVCHNQNGDFYTSHIRMKKPHIIDLRLHYGDDFPEIHTQLLKALQEKNSTGITFLHGPPGTGKTYYLRYLINEIKGKRLIYIPPDLVHDITKPSFLPFLMEHPNSILIIEDAENIIHDRKDVVMSSNQAVSNLLNMSDGLLGDAVHQQIICTFNCDIRSIDSALVRDGRLVLEHRFDKLSAANARRLCEKLGVENKGEDIREAMTLAEIYARTNPHEETTIITTTDEPTTNGTNNTKKSRRPIRKRKLADDSSSNFYA